jgi:hypothetical protein
MPNWFYFSLNVSGEKKDVEQFVENVKGSDKFETQGREFDFNHFIPQPENIFRGNLGNKEEEHCKKNGLPDWYTWNNANWGTKWNAVCDDEMAISVDGFPFEHEYNLSTAWAFPTPVIQKMIDMYPNLDFTIVGEEESNAYGVYIVSSEEIWEEEEPDIIDEDNNREVYYDNDAHLWMYLDNDEEVEDSDSFYPMAKYSWT